MTGNPTPLKRVRVTPRIVRMVTNVTTGRMRNICTVRKSFGANIGRLLNHAARGGNMRLAISRGNLSISICYCVGCNTSIPGITLSVRRGIGRRILCVDGLRISRIGIRIINLITPGSRSDACLSLSARLKRGT